MAGMMTKDLLGNEVVKTRNTFKLIQGKNINSTLSIRVLATEIRL
jgi:hypothetical protein